MISFMSLSGKGKTKVTENSPRLPETVAGRGVDYKGETREFGGDRNVPYLTVSVVTGLYGFVKPHRPVLDSTACGKSILYVLKWAI